MSLRIVAGALVAALLGCGSERDRCLDPDVCDALMVDVRLPFTHSYRGSAEFEWEGVLYTYAEIHYAGRSGIPGGGVCALWDGERQRGRLVSWTYVEALGSNLCPNGSLPELAQSCWYPDGLGPIQASPDFYAFATWDSTLPGPVPGCRSELMSRQDAGTWPAPARALP
jgi:hypothetical protein